MKAFSLEMSKLYAWTTAEESLMYIKDNMVLQYDSSTNLYYTYLIALRILLSEVYQSFIHHIIKVLVIL